MSIDSVGKYGTRNGIKKVVGWLDLNMIPFIDIDKVIVDVW